MPLVWIGVVVALALVGLLVLWGFRLRSRFRHYRELAGKRPALCQGREPVVRAEPDGGPLAGTFAQQHLIRVDHFLDAGSLQRLQDEGVANIPKGIRSYVPTHKKGRSLPYESLHHNAPTCLAFYHSPAVQEWIGRVVGEKIFPAGDHDQSACSLLIYDQTGDHIGWHYDHNFYKGRQFTVLLSLVNKSENGGLSASQYVRKLPDGQTAEVDTRENALVLFEGSQVLHKATATNPGDLRVILSMTYNTVPRISWFGEFIRRCKDIAFHGVKALWD